MRIVLLHYHQRPSGVTQIIRTQRAALENLGHEVVIPVLPELNYCQSSELTAAELLQKLKATCGRVDLWLIHNPTLGKNILFPDLIQLLAEEKARLVLQCHDFAEDGRPSNYQVVRDCDHLFPIAPQIHYAVINQRDAGILETAGIPESQLHYLPNAVMREAIPQCESTHALVFYPVRGIRRKNIGELCLWAKHAPSGTRFAIAKAPENPAWLPNFRKWEEFAHEEGLLVEFDVVTDEQPFDYWLEKTTHLATTSIAEGFGLTFIEPQFLGRPLMGRDLPEITCDFKSEGLTLDQHYQEIPIPLEWLDLKTLELNFREEIEASFQAYGEKIDASAAWGKFIALGKVDFGNLPETHQRKIIQEREIPWLRSWISKVLSSETSYKQDVTHWSPETYKKRLSELISSLKDSKSGELSHLPKENILVQFLNPDRFHFLRT